MSRTMESAAVGSTPVAGSRVSAAIFVVLAPLALTSGASLGAVLLLGLLVVVTARGDESLAGGLLIVSSIYLPTNVVGIPVPFLAVAAYVVLKAIRVGVQGSPRLTARGVLALVLAATTIASGLTISYQTDAAVYVWQELAALWVLIFGAELSSGQEISSTDGRHLSVLALSAVGVVAGYDALRVISENSAQFQTGRQLESQFGGSNLVAALLSLVVVSTWTLALHGGRQRLLWFLVGSVGFIAMIPLASRTSTVVTLAAMIALGATSRYRSLVLVVVPLALYFAASAIQSLLIFKRLSEGLPGLDRSGRVRLWEYAIHLIERAPVLGVGPGKLTDNLSSAGITTQYCHNVALSMMAQYGIPLGLLALLCLFPVTRIARERPTIILGVSVFVIALSEPTVEGIGIGIPFVVLLNSFARRRD